MESWNFYLNYFTIVLYIEIFTNFLFCLCFSVLNFARDCDYTLTMVDNLLDLLTGGEHRKAKNIIDEHRRFREEEERVRELMDIKSNSHVPTPSSKSDLSNLKIEFEQLKTLSEFGIDTSFLTEFGTFFFNLLRNSYLIIIIAI